MNPTRIITAVVAGAVIACLSGCFCDAMDDWLQPDSILQRDLDLAGDWNIVGDEFGNEYRVTLEKNRDQRVAENQAYYLKVIPLDFETRFHFTGVVHEVNGLKFVQIRNFSHYHDEVISLANRPTVSLWQIAYDQDNIILWAPGFLSEDATALKTMRDSDGKLFFTDSTANLRSYVAGWAAAYGEMKDSIDMIMPIALTRAGTEFAMPAAMEDLVPVVYERYMREQEDGSR
jgi:hypothetical protein